MCFNMTVYSVSNLLQFLLLNTGCCYKVKNNKKYKIADDVVAGIRTRSTVCVSVTVQQKLLNRCMVTEEHSGEWHYLLSAGD